MATYKSGPIASAGKAYQMSPGAKKALSTPAKAKSKKGG